MRIGTANAMIDTKQLAIQTRILGAIGVGLVLTKSSRVGRIGIVRGGAIAMMRHRWVASTDILRSCLACTTVKTVLVTTNNLFNGTSRSIPCICTLTVHVSTIRIGIILRVDPIQVLVRLVRRRTFSKNTNSTIGAR